MGVKQSIPSYMLAEHSQAFDLEKYMLNRLNREMSLQLMEELLSADGPVTVRLTYQSTKSYEHGGIDLMMIADLVPAQTMQVMIAELPPFEFIAPWREKTVEWQCGYCGQVNLVEEHLDCRKCGAPRRVMR
ncbi:MAG TPA: hypothetical protein PKD55_01465 [Bellilinea sp.]|nr:hypothetical protein [Bellilinea sp.]